ncbi:hypothetical protein FGG08_002274 [Glutinoglossum americanum]|uniref:Uncharacterized protein n=1 Tax=Glutinoglossum americanum TaxID=1670608 RepID=A0A9P8I0H4_9PEZI|nr:hypothetical protein FGG08_002274 [Glutinoglossum americanum]
MITLQTTFTYDDTKPSPTSHATILATFPQYEALDDTATQTVTLTATGQSAVSFDQILASGNYHVTIPSSELFGPEYGSVVIGYFKSLTKNSAKPRLADVTIPFGVSFGGGDGAGTAALEALYFVKGAKYAAPLPPPRPASITAPAIVGLTAAPTVSISGSSSEKLSLLPPGFAIPVTIPPIESFPFPRKPLPPISRTTNGTVDNSIFCLNKQVYLSYLKQLFPSLSGENESVLLYLISSLVDLSGPAPSLASGRDITNLQTFNSTLNSFGLPNNDAAYTTLTKNFTQFFDFPLKMPKTQSLSMAGSFHINAPATTKLAMAQFALYRLSANFSVKEGRPDDEPTQHISRYDWDPNTVSTLDNTIKFAFKDQCTLNTITGPVRVSVTGYDNVELYTSSFETSDPALQNLNIAVDLRAPPIIKGGVPGQDSNRKIRGKVVSLGKGCALKGTVIVQAKVGMGTDIPWTTVATGDSDMAGNFTMPYPYGKYVSAQALISLDSASVTPVATDPDSATSESISSDFLYILIRKPAGNGTETDKDDCTCGSNTTAGRLPSHDDLIQSDQYTQDFGGTCMNLTVPNRTLREFNYTALVRNSDPDVANYTLSSTERMDPGTGVRMVSYQLTSHGKISRRLVDLNNPIKWQDASATGSDESLYEAVTVSTGHVLHYKSEFRADGYSLGDLLYSLPLAPGQKKEIVIFDSSHSFRGSETQSLSQTERLASDLLSERDIVDQIGGNIGEQLAGSSEATTEGVSATAGASGGGMGYSANVGVAGGYAKSGSSAQQSSGRDLAGHFSETLRQGVHQNASSYRKQNSSIVTTAQEAQHFQAESTVVANHNHCHSITIMHYQVLRHFAVFQELVDVEECVFIPFPLTKFSPENISKWADTLSTHLLPLKANTYMNPSRFYTSGPRHPLIPAFDALERVRTNWDLVDWPTGPYNEEPIIWAQGEFSVTTNIPRPNTRYDMIRSLPIVTQYHDDDIAKSFFLGVITGGLSLLVGGSSGTETQARADISDKFIRLDPTYQTRPPADCIRLINLDPVSVAGARGFDPAEFFADSPVDKAAWQAYANVLGYPQNPDGVRSMLKLYFLNATISEWDGIWRDKVAPAIFDAIYKSIAFGGANMGDFALMNRYRGGQETMRITFSGSIAKTRKDTQFITIGSNRSAVAALQQSNIQVILTTLRISYSTQHYSGILFNGTVNNDLLDGVTVFCPQTQAEMRNPRIDDRWNAQRLITHLNRNLEYYNRVLLYSLDAQRRFMLLDGFHIEVFTRDGQPAGYHSLSSVLKNSPVGMAGNSIAFPVSPGYKVDRSVILQGSETSGSPTSLLELYRPEVPTPPYRISVPCKGIYSESMMGQCDSCEKLKPDSSQDWTKFTTDEPTAINPIQPPVPQVTTYQPTTKDFAPPMISIQNAPAAPAPGAGLAGVTDLLGKAGIFKDVTGLDANQQNAIKTLLSNNESARASAGMATSMATQSHNTSNSSQIMGTIQQAQDSGILTKEEAGQLVKQHIQSQIDGGQAQKASIDQQKPSLSGAAVAAVNNKMGVEASTVDEHGGVSTVKITPGPSSTVTQAKVQPTVPVVLQKPGTDTCWAAAATMLASWKVGKLLTPEAALQPAGDMYVTMWQNGVGLRASQKDDFIAAMNMTSEPPASYPPSQYVTWMKTFGPLWITTDAALGPSFSPHAKILVQIDGDGNDNGSNTTLTWINPSNGNTTTQSFKDFLVSYEQMVTDNSGSLFTQIVHYKDKISSEGSGLLGPFDIIGTPVHENLTLSALIDSDFKLGPTTTIDSSSAATREFLRGVFWNDDPACLLFDDKDNDNWNFSSGLMFGANFKLAENAGSTIDMTNITGRTHFWDLQFLHAMASDVGEDPHDTLGKVTLWLEIAYKLSIGQGISGTDVISSIPITNTVNTRVYRLSDFFTTTTTPKSSDTLRTLLTANTIYKPLDLARRAIGSCLHVVQDSYMKAHTRRKLLNPGDLVPGSTDTFTPGKFAQLGEIETFHTYRGQDKVLHEKYDNYKGPMNPASPASFDPLYGARVARDRSVELANFWVRKVRWEDGVKTWLLGTVFPFSATIGPADNSI